MTNAYVGAGMGFTKLFSSLVHSTVWREEMHVKVVWVTMLALANRHGDVLASVPGLADASRVSLEQCVDALEKLKAPDPWSRTKEHEGRRVIEVDGGWRLLNYTKYREIRDADERRIQTREAVRRHRAKKAKPVTVSNVSRGEPRKPKKAQAEAEAEAEAETTQSKTLVALKGDESQNGKGSTHRGAAVPAIIEELKSIGAETVQRLAKDVLREVQVKIAFAYWASRLGHQQTLLDRKRAKLLSSRLAENDGNLSELLYAVDGALKDDWIMGRDPKSTKRYDGIETIFQDRAHIEKYAATVTAFREGKPHAMAVKYAGH